jgi:LDH2 family malate/lactate/ureidoglycolate dehydrogenase
MSSDVAQHVPADTVRDFVARILGGAGVDRHDAAIVAESLVLAELRGQSSHGLARLETYVKRVQAGLIAKRSSPTVVYDAPALRIYDANYAFGHVVGRQVMDDCIQRARSQGVAAAAVRNSTHFGIAGGFALRAARTGMIGIVASNGAARMPPHGTRTAVLGTNPLAIAVPVLHGEPIVLDMATSATALGRILVARDQGQSIPQGWALTRDGRDTTDAAEAIAGLMLPMAGPKGFGLAFMLEVLSACLSQAAVGQHAGSMYNTWDASERLGHFFLAIDVPRDAAAGFFERVADLARQVRSAQPLAEARPMLPGEIESELATARTREGLELEPALRASLERLAVSVGVQTAL